MDVKKICTYTRREKKRVNRIESVTKKKAKKTKLVESEEEEEGEGEEKIVTERRKERGKVVFCFSSLKKQLIFMFMRLLFI